MQMDEASWLSCVCQKYTDKQGYAHKAGKPVEIRIWGETKVTPTWVLPNRVC